MLSLRHEPLTLPPYTAVYTTQITMTVAVWLRPKIHHPQLTSFVGFSAYPEILTTKKWTGNVSTEPQVRQSRETLWSNPVRTAFIKWHDHFSWSQPWLFSTALCANLMITLCGSTRGRTVMKDMISYWRKKVLEKASFLLSSFCSLLQEIPATWICGPETV